MLRFGIAPYLECSSAGDVRFSAFYARPRSLKGQSIEEAYQAAKVFADGSTGLIWRQAKGRHAVNQEECAALYERLWFEWVREQELLPVLLAATGLSDRFGQEGHVCQAEVLWRLRNGE
jgi:hypothetical protein